MGKELGMEGERNRIGMEKGDDRDRKGEERDGK